MRRDAEEFVHRLTTGTSEASRKPDVAIREVLGDGMLLLAPLAQKLPRTIERREGLSVATPGPSGR
jgi:hypothetical protein